MSKKTITKRTTFIVLGVIGTMLLIIWILPVSLPILLAFLTALLLSPVVNLFQMKAKIKRQYAVIITFLVFICLIGFGGYFLTSKVVSEAIQLIERSPHYINELRKTWDETGEKISTRLDAFPPEFVYEINRQVNMFFDNTRTKLIQFDYFGYLTNFVTKIPSLLVSFLVYLIALFLMMLEMPRLKQGLFSLLKDETAEKVNFMTARLAKVFIGFLKGQVFVSLIIFFVSLIGLFMIVPDLALVMAFVIWIIDVIPIIGSIVILGPWSMYAFITGEPVTGTKLAILALILLTIRRVVEPKVMGNQIGLSPLPTLISMYLGLKLIGIIGFFVGPLVVIIFNSAREANIIQLKMKL